MGHQICWLASYPKSGNTWLRVFLSNYWQNGKSPANINALWGGPIASARQVFDDAMGVEASDLTAEEIDRYRPAVYRRIAERSEETLFMKVHDAWTRTSTGVPLFPPDATRGAIYLLRNPLDVAVSFAHHANTTVDTMIARLADTYSFSAKPGRLHLQLRQGLLTWSDHVKSWIDAPDFPVHVMRYEDMVRQPLETFTAAIRFAGLPDEPVRICKAVRFSRFDHLQAQEDREGFKEKAPEAASFFRQGQVGAWRQVLTETQVARIRHDHSEVMRRFGYITDSGDLAE